MTNRKLLHSFLRSSLLYGGGEGDCVEYMVKENLTTVELFVNLGLAGSVVLLIDCLYCLMICVLFCVVFC